MSVSAFQTDISISGEGFTTAFVSPEIKLLLELTDLLELYFRTEKNPDFYSQALNITGWYMNKICKCYYSKTFYEMLLDRLFKESQFLLLNTTMSAKLIAFELGFRDACYFSNFFKQRTGMSPLLWRKVELGGKDKGY